MTLPGMVNDPDRPRPEDTQLALARQRQAVSDDWNRIEAEAGIAVEHAGNPENRPGEYPPELLAAHDEGRLF